MQGTSLDHRYRATITTVRSPQLSPALAGNAGIELRRKTVSDLSKEKLQKLIELEGYEDDVALIASAVSDSVCPAICMNEGCHHIAEMEPDQDRGWCEVCNTNSMKSALVLAGII